jgi:hypothetical protein
LGQHELLIRLASGGAANVFLVRDTAAPPPGRILALKVLLPQLAANDDFLNMFFTEAKIAAHLSHPNIVAIAGFGQADGIHCLAMEYVFGASLAQALRASAKARKPLTVGVLLRITAAVCDALHHAHELRDERDRPMGLVHRDVSPQNILIGFNGVPKLTDFGIAKATNRGWETQAGVVKGKFSYMSPEQALGKKVDRRSDIFCTGIVLWEALTGRELFKGSTPMEVLEAIREQPIRPPSEVVPGLSPIVDPIVMKALRRSPSARYQSGAEMRQDIEDLFARAGVTVDAKTISKEFAEIFGDVIVDRAFALRAAMAGRADLDELARALGGAKLSEEHLPIIPGGNNDPDPLGLFGGSEGPGIDDLQEEAEEDEPAHKANGAVAAAVEQGFTRTFNAAQVQLDEEFYDADSSSSEQELEEISSLEPDLDIDETSGPVSGWDDNQRTSIPDDELLSMISEQDATIGVMPSAFAARFGDSLSVKIARDEILPDGYEDGEAEFDSEATISSAAAIQTEPPPPPSPRRLAGQLKKIRDQSTEASKLVPISSSAPSSSVKVARSLLDDGGRSRPIPRAPSLDMSSDAFEETTPPPVDEGPRPVHSPRPNHGPRSRPISTLGPVRPSGSGIVAAVAPRAPSPPPAKPAVRVLTTSPGTKAPSDTGETPIELELEHDPVRPEALLGEGEDSEGEAAVADELDLPVPPASQVGVALPPLPPLAAVASPLAALDRPASPMAALTGSQSSALTADALRELVGPQGPDTNAGNSGPRAITPEVPLQVKNGIQIKPGAILLAGVLLLVVGVVLGVIIMKYVR